MLLGLLRDLRRPPPGGHRRPRPRPDVRLLAARRRACATPSLAAVRDDERVLLLGCGTRSVRFRPALTVSVDDLAAGVAALDRVLTRLTTADEERLRMTRIDSLRRRLAARRRRRHA